MAKNPSYVAINPYANRQVLTDLGLLNPKSYDTFINKYKSIAKKNYIVLREAQNSRAGGATGEYTKNKEFSQWQQKGKSVPSFKLSAAASGTAGANVTATVATEYYQASKGVAGVYSPPAAGHYYYNDTTGATYQIVSKNEATPGAHTVVLRSTDGAAINIGANDILIFDVTVVGEASGSQQGIYRVDEKVSNWCATIKSTKTFSDWNLFEEIDMPGPYTSWKPRQMADEYDLFMYQQERLLMFGKPFTNIAGVENMHTGLIPQVIANGQKMTTQTEINDSYIDDLTRLTDAEGSSNVYDLLAHLELRMKWERYIESKGGNGGFVYAQGDAFQGDGAVINMNFKAIERNGVRINLMTYDHFSTANMVGAPVNTGYYKNAGLLIPRGEGVDPDSGIMKPRFNIRWQGLTENAPAIRVRPTGGLAPQPTDDIEILRISHVATKGLQVFGLNGFIWTQLAA